MGGAPAELPLPSSMQQPPSLPSSQELLGIPPLLGMQQPPPPTFPSGQELPGAMPGLMLGQEEPPYLAAGPHAFPPGMDPCEALVREMGLMNLLGSSMEGHPPSTATSPLLGRLGSKGELPGEALQKLIQEKRHAFRQFMAGAAEAMHQRLGNAETVAVETVLSNISGPPQGPIRTAMDTGAHTINGIFDQAADTVKSTVDRTISGIETSVLDPWPAIYAVFASTPTAEQHVAPGSFRPFRGLQEQQQNVDVSNQNHRLDMAIVPAQLGHQLYQLGQTEPRLLDLFQFFSNPSAAPTFVTLRTLLDQIDRQGTFNGVEQFTTFLEPVRKFGDALGLQVGVASTVLDFLKRTTSPDQS